MVGDADADDLEILVPEALQAGAYGNGAVLWYTAHEFTLDFIVQQEPPGTSTRDRVVARVRIPPTLVFDLLRGLSETLTRYEGQFGEIKRFDPEDT
jgi:hypothetical protein